MVADVLVKAQTGVGHHQNDRKETGRENERKKD